jgi:hypothetical protein
MTWLEVPESLVGSEEELMSRNGRSRMSSTRGAAWPRPVGRAVTWCVGEGKWRGWAVVERLEHEPGATRLGTSKFGSAIADGRGRELTRNLGRVDPCAEAIDRRPLRIRPTGAI